MVGQLEGQTGTYDLLKDMISRKLPGLGITPWRMESHVSQWLWPTLKKNAKEKCGFIKYEQHSLQPWTNLL